MTNDEIIVGRFYTHQKANDVIYLGIGKRLMWTGDLTNNAGHTEKHLCIVQSTDNEIGLIVKENEDCIPNWWDGYEILPETFELNGSQTRNSHRR